jgi:hypothetical protein
LPADRFSVRHPLLSEQFIAVDFTGHRSGVRTSWEWTWYKWRQRLGSSFSASSHILFQDKPFIYHKNTPFINHDIIDKPGHIYIMTYHDISWHIMTYHDISW